VNLIPVPKKTGISEGYLRPADGVVSNGSGPGVTRGGISWNGVCYRVMGTKLCRVDESGAVEELGDVGTGGRVSLTYSFDRLAVASGGRLYYWNGSTLSQVTDPDLGTVLDVEWVDGYFLTTDGTFLIQTDLTDPNSVNPLRYGSSEIDPDPIVALVKLRNEIYALNRNTVELFDNVGGEFFAFARIEGAQIHKGCIGTHAACVYMDAVAFLGSGRNESPGVYIGANSQAAKISTREVDQILLGFTESQLTDVVLEVRNDKSNQHLFMHLPDRTLVYDGAASQAAGEHVWFVLVTAIDGFSQFRARDLVWAYDKWTVGDPQSSAIGYLDQTTAKHWGQHVRWEFQTQIAYNQGKSAVFNELELVSLTGNVALGENPTISTSYSKDGETWSQPRFIRVGTIGARLKRLVWWQQGTMGAWRIQRFKGTSASSLSFARLEAQIEPLSV